MTDGIIEVDDDRKVTTINHSAEAIYGRIADEMIGRNLWALFPEVVDTPFSEVYCQVMETDDETTIQEYYEPLQSWFEVHVYPGASEGLSIYSRKPSEREGQNKQDQ